MMNLDLKPRDGRSLNVLCLGAHSDDIEIGCGGTVLRLAQQFPQAVFDWVVFSAIGIREAEARCAAGLFAGEGAVRELLLKEFPDGFMPYVGGDIKRVFEDLKQRVSPDIIFAPYRRDAHQDHRLIAELTWNTFRDHLILEYEIPKYDGDLGQPSIFVPLRRDLCKRKVSNLLAAFRSQTSKPWFTEDTFLSLLRLRGVECNAPDGYAEAFYCKKLVI